MTDMEKLASQLRESENEQTRMLMMINTYENSIEELKTALHEAESMLYREKINTDFISDIFNRL